MKFLFYSILATSFLGTAAMGGEILPKNSTYVGYIYLPATNEKFPTVMDIIKEQGPITGSKFRASIRYSFGGFNSHEYLTQVYTIDRYDWTDPRIALDSNKPGGDESDISLYEGMVSPDGNSIEGHIRFSKSPGMAGEFKVVHYEDATQIKEALAELFPQAHVKPLLSGEYQSVGKCHKSLVDVKLQILALKNQSSEGHSYSPMSGYEFHGSTFLIGTDRNDGKAKVSKAPVDTIYFDPYRSWLSIPGIGNECKMTAANGEEGSATRITCNNGCTLQKTTSDAAYFDRNFVRNPHRFEGQGSKDNHFEVQPTIEMISGNYQGYIHMETTNLYQQVVFDVRPFGLGPRPDSAREEQRSIASISASIFMGDKDRDVAKSVNFAFNGFSLPANGSLIGATLQTQDDALLVIKEWGPDHIVAKWYSNQYGRVGKVVLNRKKSPDEKLHTCTQSLQPIEGQFTSTYSTKHLRKGIHTHINSDLYLNLYPNPQGISSFPYQITGYAASTVHIGRHLEFSYRPTTPITGGYYDPFIGFMVTEAKDDWYAAKQWQTVSEDEKEVKVLMQGYIFNNSVIRAGLSGDASRNYYPAERLTYQRNVKLED